MNGFGYDPSTGRIINGIKARRDELGMTQTALAKALHTDKAQMSRLEAGALLATPDQILRLEAVLRRPASLFYPTDPFATVIARATREVELQAPLTRRQRVLQRLQATPGVWVPGMELMNAQVGGTRAGGRIFELRREGYTIEERRDPEHRSAVSQYRLVEDAG